MRIYCVMKNDKQVSSFYGSPVGVVGSFAQVFCDEHPGAKVDEIRSELIKDLVFTGSVEVLAGLDKWTMQAYESDESEVQDEI